MDDALEQWLSRVEGCLLAWPCARQVVFNCARTGDGVAQYRLRATLLDGSMVQCAERACYRPGGVHTEKYSFHWQHADGHLIRRWDNAPHHPEIANFPHHVHVTNDANVFAHEAMDVFGVLEQIEKLLAVRTT